MVENVSMMLSPARILIVDDHPNTASMLARVLGKFETPVEVLTAHSGEEALEIASDGPVDILITDFIMAGINGLDLVEKLRGEREPAHKILITAYDTPGLAVTARSLQVQDYLVKPVQPEKIREIVGQALKELRPERPGNGEPARQRQFKILVADDYPDNIRLLVARLKNEGYAYITAVDGEETLQKARIEKPDLVLLDVNMPKKDGFQVLTEMRSDPDLAHIQVIVVTAARLSASDIREGLTLGADDYVTKPIDWRELSARIRNKLRVKEAEDNLRKRNRELEVLPELSQDLGERLDVEALTKTILARTVGALQANNGHLVVFHPDGSVTHQVHKLYNQAPWKWEDVHSRIVSRGMVAQILQDPQPVIVEDTRECEENCEFENASGENGLFSSKPWIGLPGELSNSVVGIPLQGRDRVLAVLILTHEQPKYFKQEHLALLQAISSQASIAIENAQLYAGERKRVNDLVALNLLAREISRYTRSGELFERLPVSICQMFGYPAAALWLVQDSTLVLKSICGAENALRPTLLEIGPQRAVISRQPVQLSGPIAENSSEKNNGTGRLSELPVQSVIAVPLVWNDVVGGVISIHSKRAGAFQESDRILLETLTAHVGNVLERIELFEASEREQKRLAAVLNGAADAILVMDAQGRLELANPAGERLFTDIDARVGQPLPSQRGYDEMIELLNQARQTNTPIKGDVLWPDERTFSVVISPVESSNLPGDGTPVSGIPAGQVALLHDVSHLKALDQLKNEFLATASHDLKNPIFAILGYSDLIKRAGPLNEMQTDFTLRIRNSAVQMQELVLNLLDMARMDMGVKMKTDAVDLNELMTEIGEEFRTRVEEKKHSLTYALSPAAAVVTGDRMRLQQVARNLISNAIKYTPEGGQIVIKTRVEPDKVIASFQDTGIGIPEEALPKLFSKFYRVRTKETEDIEGNGLGLAIVKAILEQHGGMVAVESRFGEGSCFSITLKPADAGASAVFGKNGQTGL